MGWEAWATIAVVVLCIAALARNVGGPDIILLGGLALLTAMGIVGSGEAVAGFGNEGLVTVAALFMVVTGLTQTGAMAMIVQPLLGRPTTVPVAQARLMLPVAGLSAFLNNTPIVAMFLPVLSDWCKKTGIAPAKLFLPLSYAAILGGTCTLIGTSTNLVVNGMLLASPDLEGFNLFDIAWVALPALVVGLSYILLTSRWLLPDRGSALDLGDDPRQYTVEMIVDPAGPLVGQTIEQAGLRHLPGLYLAEIERNSEVLPAVAPTTSLHGSDRLVFVGIVESVVDLRKIRGLLPATNQVFKLDAPRTQRTMLEAVVSDSCPLVGKSIREGRFRSTYNAAVIAVARNGQRILNMKIGDIVLRPGDTLLIEAHPSFARQQRNSRDFFLVSQVEGSTPPRHERAWLAMGLLVGMVAVVTLGYLTMLQAALLAAVAMIVTRCCTGTEARRNVDWRVLIVIGAAFGIGQAMANSGAADGIAGFLINVVGENPWLTLLAVYIVTSIFTELITNNAAAVLVFPIALASATSLDVNFTPFAIAIMMAASAAFATPIGYQTNLMVLGPGGYRFTDYVRFGVPLNLLVMLVTVTLAPLIWPF
ncbi:SLC13 family permease [Phycisphaerales bacterium AB-hyl4]|uniref:SLC13 family permease n=1 Tax=Natronomicrosphaera hydrolytica TaxID=3242702 RepID=A0ABV4U8E7_9BACT